MPYQLRLDEQVKTQYPNYTALIIYARGLSNDASDAYSTALLKKAEQAQRQAFGEEKASSHPHIAAWREAYKSFGLKPSKYNCSVEALLSRTLKGQDLPNINRVVDIYNAVSVKYVLPVGGEDWDYLTSDLSLQFATGREPFVARQAGETVTDYPAVGEVIWADSSGVTCRAWNWRQGERTMLTTETRNAYFVLDCLPPFTLETLQKAGDELIEHLKETSPGCTITTEFLGKRPE